MRPILLLLALLFTLSAQAQTQCTAAGRLPGRVQSFWWVDSWGVQ